MKLSPWLAALIITPAFAQAPAWLERLPMDLLDVQAPTVRVSGMPGSLSIAQISCNSLPLDGVRRRIVNTAIQEWGFFGFSVIDQTEEIAAEMRRTGGFGRRSESGRPLTADLNQRADDEVLQIALSVGGYWAATPDGRWMLERQNEAWQGPLGYRSDWRDFWSAAFISWVMCEGGLGNKEQFQRSIAHHDYIDQAILARDGKEPSAAYVAYDIGEAAVAPGDLLCRGSRPEYGSLAERRAHLEEGARTHCDIVVKVDEQAGEIWAIGGNVSDSVRLKRLPAEFGRNGLQTVPYSGRMIFAHLQLQAPAIETNALDNSPTMLALACTMPSHSFLAAGVVVTGEGNC